MKTLPFLLIGMVCPAYGQVLHPTIPHDSIPAVRPGWRTVVPLVPNPPDPRANDPMPIVRPNRIAVVPMPTTRPDNAFYRSPTDPANVVRATLDNMPIYGYDTTARHSPSIRRIRPRK